MPPLPTSYNTNLELTGTEHMKLDVAAQDDGWSLARLDLSDIGNVVVSPVYASQKMLSWSAFNSLVTHESNREMKIGCFHILPHPVTEHATVYTVMKIFQTMLKKPTWDRTGHHLWWVSIPHSKWNNTDSARRVSQYCTHAWTISHVNNLPRVYWKVSAK